MRLTASGARMGKKHGDRKAKDKTEDIQGFFQHLIVFVVVNVVLILINLISSPGSLWFYWVTLFWGIGIAIQAFDAFAIDRRLAERVTSGRETAPPRETEQSKPGPQVKADGAASSELREITTQASELIDRMRTSARQIPNPEARREALSACAASDQVLSALIDHPDELPIARDFLHRFLEPASTVITDYARLANRNVPSARDTLEAVETHDLPMITRRANDVYDRLHRGTLIDLEVAREMLTLDMAEPHIEEAADRG